MKTKFEIYEESITLFYENGFDNTHINDILSKTNISKDLFESYFKDKNEILYLIYKNIYETAQSTLIKISNQDITCLVKLKLLVTFLGDLAKKESVLLSIIEETKPKLNITLPTEYTDLLNELYKSIIEKETIIINDCKSSGYIVDISTSIIINLLQFIIKSELSTVSNFPKLNVDSAEVDHFFWNTILVDKII